MTEESIIDFKLRDFRGKKGGENVKTPTVLIARGYDRHIPMLASSGRPIVCISDWQCETSTQRYFWKQAWIILKQRVGSKLLERALVIVAGDMASKDNALRGAKSDDVPDFSWLQESFPKGDILIVYGNHDYMSREHLQMINQSSGVPSLLPHGSCVGLPVNGTRVNLVSPAEIDSILDGRQPTAGGPIQLASVSQPAEVPDFLQYMTNDEQRAYYEKQPFPKNVKSSQNSSSVNALQWDREHPEQARLTACFRQVQSLVEANGANLEEEGSPSMIRVGAVHGIPAAHTQGLQKIEREEYFQALSRVCDPSTPTDVLVTHCNPCVPGAQEAIVRGDDPRRIYSEFLRSQACLHVCGHTHLDPPVSVVAEGKVVANADCRVIVFVPPSV